MNGTNKKLEKIWLKFVYNLSRNEKINSDVIVRKAYNLLKLYRERFEIEEQEEFLNSDYQTKLNLIEEFITEVRKEIKTFNEQNETYFTPQFIDSLKFFAFHGFKDLVDRNNEIIVTGLNGYFEIDEKWQKLYIDIKPGWIVKVIYELPITVVVNQVLSYLKEVEQDSINYREKLIGEHINSIVEISAQDNVNSAVINNINKKAEL